MIDTLQQEDEPAIPDPIPPVIIRRMRLDDIEYVSRLERKCYSLPWNSSAYVTEVGNPSAYYTVAKDMNGVIVGYAGMWVVMDEAHITTIAVDPDLRGLKIGERLLIDMMLYAIQHGGKRSTLEVREHNIAAHNLYKKFGFTDVAMRRRYYSDNGENAIIMWANDIVSDAYWDMLQTYIRDLQQRSEF